MLLLFNVVIFCKNSQALGSENLGQLVLEFEPDMESYGSTRIF